MNRAAAPVGSSSTPEHRQTSYAADHEKIVARLRRIEGQVCGIWVGRVRETRDAGRQSRLRASSTRRLIRERTDRDRYPKSVSW
jgi:hypothetical protein